MKYTKTEKGIIIVLARGENVIETLTDFCTKENITAGVFQGIGAVERVKIGYYDLGKKEYFFRDEPGIFEVASMQGNVALVEGKPFIHAHAVLSRCDETCERSSSPTPPTWMRSRHSAVRSDSRSSSSASATGRSLRSHPARRGRRRGPA